ncbi:MAG: hypothetical protein LC754_07670 [Acidobacteria bacterium]|nr:hypothetical protein [Acidobacteriota bacterium]
MIEVHRGAGILVPTFGILSALFMHIVTIKLYGDSYYQEHRWPISSALLLAGILCLVVGLWLEEKRFRDSEKEFGVRPIAFIGTANHLLRVPLHYWSIVYFLAALVYGMKNSPFLQLLFSILLGLFLAVVFYILTQLFIKPIVASVFFPYYTLLGVTFDSNSFHSNLPFMTIGLLQYPVYCVVLKLAIDNSRFYTAALALLVIHALIATLSIVFILKSGRRAQR